MAEIAIITVLIIAATAAGSVGWRWWQWKALRTTRVMVQLDDGPALSGLVESRRGDVLILIDVSVHAERATQRMDGKAVIHRGRIVWIQTVQQP